MKIFLILLFLILYSSSAQAWGTAPAIITASNKNELIIIQHGNPFVSVIYSEQKKMQVRYGPLDRIIRTDDIIDIEKTADTLKMIYKKFICFDSKGINDCKIEDVLGIRN